MGRGAAGPPGVPLDPLRPFGEFDLNLVGLVVPHIGQLDPVAGPALGQVPGDSLHGIRLLAVDISDYVAAFKTGPGSRCIGEHLAYKSSRFNRKLLFLRRLRIHGLSDHAQPGIFDLALVDDLLHDFFRGVDRDREADSHGTAGGGSYLLVKAYHFTAGIEQGSTTVALVDGSVGLNCILDPETGLRRFNCAIYGTDYSGGKGAGIYTEGAADSDNRFADYDRAGITESHRHQVESFGVDFDNSDIAAGKVI